MALSTLVNATDLAAWADTRDAQEMLPRLVRRLVEQTNASLHKIHFAADESIQLPGYDGATLADAATAYVPAGTTAWELGTAAEIAKKANSDYKKRTKSPGDIDSATSTFIFVTPRRWPKKSAWVTKKRTEEKWQDVRAFDADDLAQWLERAPAVHYWISIRLGKHPEGAEDVEQFLKSWCHSTIPVLPPKFALAGRGQTTTAIADAIRMRMPSFAVRAETTREALGVIAAAILELPEDLLSPTLGRTLVVHSEESFRELSRSPDSLLLIPTFDAPDVGRALAAGHGVIQPVESDYGNTSSAHEVPRLEAEEAGRLLNVAGVPEARARDLAALARRSFSAFHRKLAVRPETQRPAWSMPANGAALIPALLLATWHESKEGDRDALAAVAGVSWDVATTALRRWLHEPDSPIRQRGDVWFIVAKEDAWLLLGRYVTSDHLERFRKLAVDVLSTRDPKFDLAADKQWAASIYGAILPHSTELRNGIAESVAILGARGDLIAHASGASGADFAAAIVSDVLEAANADWRIWATISYSLPLLAEAAPDAFLGGVEKGLAGENPVLRQIFAENDAHMFAATPHTGLLWALETIAWSPDHLTRAAAALARLAQLDPGGKLANRPAASLRTIFLPWSPQTSATHERRLKALDLIRKRTPDVGWKVLLGLLPRTYDSSMPTHKPAWRGWAPDSDPKVTWGEIYENAHETTNRLIEDAGDSPQQWLELLAAASSQSPDDRKVILNGLRERRKRFGAAECVEIWNELRDVVAQHRSFADRDGALREEFIAEFEALLPSFEPVNATDRWAWLFSHNPHLVDPPSTDFDVQRKAVKELRVKVLTEMFASGGVEAIMRFARGAPVPVEVAIIAANAGLLDDVGPQLVRDHLNDTDEVASSFARTFISASIHRYGSAWAFAWAEKQPPLTPNQLATVLSFLELDRQTFDLVGKQTEDVQSVYWKMVWPYGVQENDVSYVAEKLLQNNRPYSALDLLGRQLIFKKPIPSETAARALERLITPDPEDEQPGEMASHNVPEVLSAVGDASDLPIDRVARIEFAFVSAISRFQWRPKALHRALAEDSALFVQVLSIAYHGENEKKQERSEEETARALTAYELLDTWRVTPGPEFQTWLREARAAAGAVNRLAIADVVIGQMLGRVRSQEGQWPPEVVCESLETTASDEMDRGFSVGVANSRGVFTKSLDEGGRQERALADRYRDYADAVNDKYPRVAALLIEIATDYERSGRRSDTATLLRQDLGD